MSCLSEVSLRYVLICAKLAEKSNARGHVAEYSSVRILA
jgi:hypothetical protein